MISPCYGLLQTFSSKVGDVLYFNTFYTEFPEIKLKIYVSEKAIALLAFRLSVYLFFVTTDFIIEVD